MCRRILKVLFIVFGSLAVPTVALAQSAIAGIVKDTTGAVLPGVTVEASSPALIEKVKTVTTNEAGQYRVVDLRPGTYTVTFTLTGFNTVVREGILLEANFTAPINVEMRVGAVSENVTVTGESPVVDVQTSNRREVVSQQLLEAIPTGRSFVLMANTVPSVSTGTFDVGGSAAMWVGGSLLVHGSISQDSRTLIDGMVVDAMFGGGQCSCVYDNEAQTQEMAVQVTGGAAENQLSGVLVNRIPRTGGNNFLVEGIVHIANGATQSVNLDDAIRARGITTPDRLYRDYDVNYSAGGPIIKDKVWFFVSGRNWAYNNYVANAFNKDGSQAIDDNNLKAFPARVTWQADQKNRFTTMFDWANKVRGHRNLSPTINVDAAVQQGQPAEHILQAKWTSTVTNHLLFETGYSQTYNAPLYTYQPQVVVGTCHVAYNLCAPGTGYGSVPHQDTVLGTQYVATLEQAASGNGISFMPALSHIYMASLSYVSGAHNIKGGLQQRWGYARDIRYDVNGDANQLYQNGKPFAIDALNTPIDSRADVNADFGLFIQDTWTTKRLTVSPGFRYDHFNSSVPAQDVPAGRFVPARHFDAIPNIPNWNNVAPRIGVSYDLTGQGRTAIKGNAGLYVQSQGPGFAQTYNPMVFSTNRYTWNDLNGDDIATENEISNPANSATFGIRRNQNPDPNIDRPYQWVWDIGVQQELMRGLAVSVSYNQRSFYSLTYTTNLAIPVDSYTLTSVPNPQVPGATLPIYNADRTKFGQINELDTTSPNNTRVFKGVDVSVNMRIPGGGSLNGGTSTGRTITRTCDLEDPNYVAGIGGLNYCDQNLYHIPMLTQFKLSGTYPIIYGIRVSGSFQSQPGAERIITYQVTRAQLPTLVQTSVLARLNEPGSMYNDRVNQLDFAISKSFRVGRTDLRPEIDLFNMLNANPVTAQINSYGPTLNNATAILPPRLVRFGFTVKF
jgi:hypothetical protein